MAKYCTKCGSLINDEAQICVHCGCSVRSSNSNDSNSKSWWWLGFLTSLFLTPIIGLILWLVWRDESPMKAKQVARGTLWSFLVAVIISVTVGIIYFCLIYASLGIAGMSIGTTAMLPMLL